MSSVAKTINGNSSCVMILLLTEVLISNMWVSYLVLTHVEVSSILKYININIKLTVRFLFVLVLECRLPSPSFSFDRLNYVRVRVQRRYWRHSNYCLEVETRRHAARRVEEAFEKGKILSL